jgi:hypothetical protein
METICYRDSYYGSFDCYVKANDALMAAGFERDEVGWFSKASGSKHYAKIVDLASKPKNSELLDSLKLTGLNRIMAY